MGLVGTLFTHLTRLGIVFKVYMYIVCTVYTILISEWKKNKYLGLNWPFFKEIPSKYVPAYL